MALYEVSITETSQKNVIVEADSIEEAEVTAEANWNKAEDEYVLNAEDFVIAYFSAQKSN